MNKPVELPAGGVWTLKHFVVHGNTFILCANPGHPPMLIGRTAQGEMFVRELTPFEKAMTT